MTTQIRITQQMRNVWSKQVIKKILGPKELDFEQRVKQLITLLIDSFVKKNKKEWDNFPKEWKAKAREITVFINNDHDKCVQVKYDSLIPVPGNIITYNDRAYFNVTKENKDFYELVSNLVDEERKIHLLKKEVESELSAVLSSAKNLKQLRELWPDIDKYIDLSKLSVGGQLVRTDITKLNSLIVSINENTKTNLKEVS